MEHSRFKHTTPNPTPNQTTTLSLPLPSSHFLIFISPLIPPMFHVKHLVFLLLILCPYSLIFLYSYCYPFLFTPLSYLSIYPINTSYHITLHIIYYTNLIAIYSYLTLLCNNNKFLSNSRFHFHNQTIQID